MLRCNTIFALSSSLFSLLQMRTLHAWHRECMYGVLSRRSRWC